MTRSSPEEANRRGTTVVCRIHAGDTTSPDLTPRKHVEVCNWRRTAEHIGCILIFANNPWM